MRTNADANVLDSQNRLPSNRRFGLFFAVALGVLAILASRAGDAALAGILASLSGVFALGALLFPSALRPINRAWLELGLALGRIVNPVVQGALFFLLITPIALVTRLGGRDVLRLRRPEVDTYWTPKDRRHGSFKDPY